MNSKIFVEFSTFVVAAEIVGFAVVAGAYDDELIETDYCLSAKLQSLDELTVDCINDADLIMDASELVLADLEI